MPHRCGKGLDLPRPREELICAGILCRGNAAGRGRLAQLVERLVYTEDVGSSSLSPPTTEPLEIAENG